MAFSAKPLTRSKTDFQFRALHPSPARGEGKFGVLHAHLERTRLCRIQFSPPPLWERGAERDFSFCRGTGERCSSHEGIVQRVTGGAHRANGIARAHRIEGLAQASDMDVDRSGLDIDVRTPHRIEQLLSAE